MGNLFAKPFALGIGPQTCGTEKLRYYFKGREDVALPKVQEIFYFDRHVQRGPLFYKEHFDNVMASQLVMELTRRRNGPPNYWGGIPRFSVFFGTLWSALTRFISNI